MNRISSFSEYQTGWHRKLFIYRYSMNRMSTFFFELSYAWEDPIPLWLGPFVNDNVNVHS